MFMVGCSTIPGLRRRAYLKDIWLNPDNGAKRFLDKIRDLGEDIDLEGDWRSAFSVRRYVYIDRAHLLN
jgi:hypothetical protein